MIRTGIPFGELFIALTLLIAFVSGVGVLIWGWRRSRIARWLGGGIIGIVLLVIAEQVVFSAALEWNPKSKLTNMKSLLASFILFLATSSLAETTPTDFVIQVLEPTGGKISRPKDWFYHEGHHGPVYDWTITREDTSGHHPYTTGVRIQTFTGVKAGTGKTAREFIIDFVAAKKKEAAKVVKTCEAKDQGLFTRVCLETEEGPYHILYSLFWGSGDLDIAVVSIAGTTKELWETYAPTFDKMSAFELIDMKRFEK